MAVALTASVAGAAIRLGSRTLRLGMRGSDVTTLQRDLTEVGIRTSATGDYNRTTRAHVKRFQRAHRLSVDGIVGPRTLKKLLAVVKAEEVAARGNGGGTGGTTTTGGGSTTPTPPPPNPCSTAGPVTGGGGLPSSCNTPVKLTINKSTGLVKIPNDVPTVIVDLLQAANTIAWREYVYGGGHNGWGKQVGYDCSGSVSYVLHAAGLMNKSNGDKWKEPFDSTQFEKYGAKSTPVNDWITIYANGGHAYMKISNLYFDTAAQSQTATGKKGSAKRWGDRWTATRISTARGFVDRYPKSW
jgi:hypothetical protein